jgi:hypothetical protein
MEKLVINKSGVGHQTVAYTALASLADGAIVFYADNAGKTQLTDTGGSITEEIEVWEGCTETGPIFHGKLHARGFRYGGKVVTAAAATKVMALGNNNSGTNVYALNPPSTLTAGDVGGITTVNMMKRHDDQSRYRAYEEILVTGDTITTFMTRLIAKINADTNTNKVVATATAIDNGAAVTNGVTLAGIALTDFSAYGTGILANADVIEKTGGSTLNVIKAGSSTVTTGWKTGQTTTNLTTFTIGTGTYAQLRELELDTNPYLGDQGLTTVRGTDIFTLPSRLDTTTGYTVFTMECWTPNMNNLIEQNNSSIKFTFAVKASDSGVVAVLDNIAAILLAKAY